MDEECFVLGLDGLDYNILKDAMEERDLENFEKLNRHGVLGSLQSCHPPTTVPGWACMFTGKNPGKIGMFHFQHPNWEKRGLTPADYSSLFGKYFWDMEGIESSLAFIPGISPPYTTEGRMIEGKPGPKNFKTMPEELKDDIISEEEILVFDKKFESKANEAKAVFDVRKKAVRRLIENYTQDVLVTVYNPSDYMVHGCDSYETLYDVYEYLDEELGYFIDKADGEDASVFVVSDHGAFRFDSVFFITSWLHKHEYLPYNQERGTLHKSVLKAGYKLINLGFSKPVKMLNDFLKSNTGKDLNPESASVSDRFDWENADAVPFMIQSLPMTGIVLSDEKLEPEELQKLKKEITDKLEGHEMIEWVKEREEIYSGPRVDKMPHLIVKGADGVRMASAVHESEYMDFQAFGHGYGGVIGAYGKDIGDKSVDADLIDVAPTVLHSMGKKIPKDMDGDVKKQIFSSDMEIEYTESIDREIDEYSDIEEEEVKQRLEELGYMGE